MVSASEHLGLMDCVVNYVCTALVPFWKTHFDLSTQAFDAIANHVCGVVYIKYRPVDCNFNGNITLKFQGSNSNYVQVYALSVNGPGEILKIEMKDSAPDSSWTSLDRSSYNGWLGSIRR